MSRNERDVALKCILMAYGEDPQINMAVEEMSELIKALMKWKRANDTDLSAARNNVIDELADVRIMVRQMEILFQCENDVEEKINFKIKRQLDRLERRKAKE